MKYLSILLVLLLLSCQSKSGHRQSERVVVIDCSPVSVTHLKVKRIEKGVVMWINVTDVYEVGDTILHTF